MIYLCMDIYIPIMKGGKHMPIPKVKTGPTSGNERSRNKNGQWRKKRSDSGLSREVSRMLKKIKD